MESPITVREGRDAAGRFMPGNSIAPGRPPNMGATFLEHCLELTRVDEDGAARYDADQLRRMTRDPKCPHLRAGAAASILRLRTTGFGRSGKPLAADDLERLLDRSMGKPPLAIFTKHVRSGADPAQVYRELAALIAAHPELARLQVPAQIANDEPVDTCPVDTTARVLPAD